jgi:hypothetical protein
MGAVDQWIASLPASKRRRDLATIRRVLGGFSAGPMIDEPRRRKSTAGSARVLGLPGTGSRPPQAHVAARLEIVRALKAQGKTIAAIAAATGVSETTAERDIARCRADPGR